MRIILSILISILFFACKTPVTLTNGASGTAVVQATMRKTLPGARGSSPTTNYTFYVKWKESAAPYLFVYRSEAEWHPCRMDITAGDTVKVFAGKPGTPPSGIDASSPNHLYYRTQSGSWKGLSVGSIEKLPDVILP